VTRSGERIGFRLSWPLSFMNSLEWRAGSVARYRYWLIAAKDSKPFTAAGQEHAAIVAAVVEASLTWPPN
jgi:hypothetical protein